MTDEELDKFIAEIRNRRTSNQLAFENKRIPRRERKESSASVTKRAQLLNSLLAGPPEGDDSQEDTIEAEQDE